MLLQVPSHEHLRRILDESGHERNRRVPPGCNRALSFPAPRPSALRPSKTLKQRRLRLRMATLWLQDNTRDSVASFGWPR